MKVLILNSVYGVGSTGRICEGIAHAFINKGHECLIAYGLNCSCSPNDNVFRITNDRDIKRATLYTRLFDLHGYQNKTSTKKLKILLDNFSPDLIWMHNIHGDYVNVEILFNWFKSHKEVSVIWTLHDCWAFTGHCAYFSYPACEKWIYGCNGYCIKKKMYPRTYLVSNAHNNYIRKKKCFCGLSNLHLVTPSVWLSKLVEKSFLGQYPIKVINNGIDLSIFKPTEGDFRKHNSIDRKAKIVLGVAFEWEKRKGLDVFLELAKRMDNSFQIVLVGTNDSIDRNLPRSIISIHRTTDATELAQIYSAADVFVNPTREENYPTVNMEAIACGTPVVTFDTGGCAEILNEECGIVVDVDDIEGMEKAIRKICQDTNYRSNCLKRSVYFDMNDRFNECVSFAENVRKTDTL